jgi:hypothetical protein
MTNISENNPVPSYREEFQHGLDLFERSLHEYQKSNMNLQKEAFKKVMAEATHVMNETAPEVLKGADQDYLTHLQEDFNAFNKQASPAVMKKLQEDINKLKNIS